MTERGRRVFVSYTAELAAYPSVGRTWVQAAVDAVTRAGCVAIHMGAFTAADAPPARLCQEKVASCEVYVGLIGFCYGSPVRDDAARSYVELEYETATEAGLTRLVFPIDEEPSVTLPKRFFTDEVYGQRQAEFRQRLDAAGLTRKKTTSPEELAGLLLQALHETVQSQPTAGGAARPGPVFVVPALPAGSVPRPELTERAVELLVGAHSVGGTVGMATALRGAGGFGKTTLATQICHSEVVRAHFTDGIVWVSLGEQVRGPELAAKINDACWHLTDTRPPLTDPALAGAVLGRALGDRRILLVVDDVWSRTQLEPFLGGGPQVTRLVTTRQASVLPDDAISVNVDAMATQEASQLLLAGLPPFPDRITESVLAATGRWPVLLALVHGAARADHAAGSSAADALVEITAALTESGPTVLDVTDPDRRHAAVATTLQASLARLTPEQTERYLELAVFAEDTDIPRSILAASWQHTAGWTPYQTHRFAQQLADLSLVLDYRLDPPRLRLHDVIRAYLLHRAGDAVLGMHARLLDAHRPLAESAPVASSDPSTPDPDHGRGCDVRTPWWWLPAEADYLWRWLGYHLHGADRHEARRLPAPRAVPDREAATRWACRLRGRTQLRAGCPQPAGANRRAAVRALAGAARPAACC